MNSSLPACPGPCLVWQALWSANVLSSIPSNYAFFDPLSLSFCLANSLFSLTQLCHTDKQMCVYSSLFSSSTIEPAPSRPMWACVPVGLFEWEGTLDGGSTTWPSQPTVHLCTFNTLTSPFHTSTIKPGKFFLIFFNFIRSGTRQRSYVKVGARVAPCSMGTTAAHSHLTPIPLSPLSSHSYLRLTLTTRGGFSCSQVAHLPCLFALKCFTV